MRENIDHNPVHMVSVWLSTFAQPRKTPNPQAFAYAIKHRVEEWARALGIAVYIPSEAVAEAASLLGIRTVDGRLCVRLPGWITGSRGHGMPTADSWRQRTRDPWGKYPTVRRP